MQINYNCLMSEIEKFSNYTLCGIVGESTLGRKIPYIFVGKHGAKSVLIHGGIHAREHITTEYLLLLARKMLKEKDNLNIGIYILPNVNPDGMELAINGLNSVASADVRKKLIEINGNSKDFSFFKANINGVDLNNNFDAKWNTAKWNVPAPSPSSYAGVCANSEIETTNLCNFVKKIKPVLTISYHSKGEVIYWNFGQKGRLKRVSKKIAKGFSKITGYSLKSNAGSVGGFKDWCIESLKIPAFTIEVGKEGSNILVPQCEIENIFQKNVGLINYINNCKL